MGARGPAPEPSALKLLKGNPGHRPLNNAEPEPSKIDVEELPAPPSHMDKDAKAEWKRIGPELAAMGLLSNADLATLEGYCVMFSRAKRADKVVKQRGILIKTAWGPKLNPAIGVSAKSWEAARRFASEFGFSPSARTRIRAEKPKAKTRDVEEDFLFKGKRNA